MTQPNIRSILGDMTAAHRAEAYDWTVQQILNVERPPEGVAARLPEHEPVRVVARIEWDRDGTEWVAGHAVRWTRPVVFVQINDKRSATAGIWLAAEDVRRPT